MDSKLNDFFLTLVRLGIGRKTEKLFENIDWERLGVLAMQHGLSAVVVDGMESIPVTSLPQKEALLKWIGVVFQNKALMDKKQKSAEEMAKLFHVNGVKTYVLKGTVIAECYPKLEHRISSDLDCFLTMEKKDRGSHETAWKLGNELIKASGYKVWEDFYKNSSFHLPSLMVENHNYMTPFRGNKTLRKLELLLQRLMIWDKGDDVFEGTYLYRPPMMVSALFLVEHSYSHFLHEGLTWRMVLDWMMFREKHIEDIDWSLFEAYIDEFGFRKFYDSYYRIGKFLLGEIKEGELLELDDLMVTDIWAPLDLHESMKGLKAKFDLAGNYWRARWKYKYFTDMTWIRALMEWILGALFDRHPKLKLDY